MKLGVNKIREITTGAVRVEEENGEVWFHRFTKEQEALYKGVNDEFYKKALSTAGIKLSFKTDSKELFLKIVAQKGGSREFFSVDVFVDGKTVGYLDNFSHTVLPPIYSRAGFSLGEFSKTFSLGDGVKTVCVHLPFPTITTIKEMVVDDNAFVEGIKPEKKLLAYGDSITHGYDALRPSNRYIAKLAEMLGAEEWNKAIAAEMFFPELAKLKDSFTPDLITVAYGTNDWSHRDESAFKKNCRAFYENISRNYPDTPVFAITPIWRKDLNETSPFGDFKKIEAEIRNAVKDLRNVTVISGFGFVPHEERFFADHKLHPNDEGFAHYFNNLYQAIKSLN